jgi:surfeit locus 1 family protein
MTPDHHGDTLRPPPPTWRARLLVLLAAGATMGLTAYLSHWQYSKGLSKVRAQAQVDARRQMPELTAEVWAQEEGLALAQESRAFVAQGRWHHDCTVYLDNRPLKGAVGFAVVTPLKLDDGRILPVLRGWLPRNIQNRTEIAPFREELGAVEIRGLRLKSAPRVYALGEEGDGPIRQNLDLARYQQGCKSAGQGAWMPGLLSQRTPSIALDEVSRSDAAAELRRDWPAPAADVQKHWNYAVQWGLLCVTLGILYVWYQLVPLWRRRRLA